MARMVRKSWPWSFAEPQAGWGLLPSARAPETRQGSGSTTFRNSAHEATRVPGVLTRDHLPTSATSARKAERTGANGPVEPSSQGGTLPGPQQPHLLPALSAPSHASRPPAPLPQLQPPSPVPCWQHFAATWPLCGVPLRAEFESVPVASLAIVHSRVWQNIGT